MNFPVFPFFDVLPRIVEKVIDLNMSQTGGTSNSPPQTFGKNPHPQSDINFLTILAVPINLHPTPEKYPKLDEQDQDWVLVTDEDVKKPAATGPSSKYEFDVKLGWREKKVTIFRFCWESSLKTEACRNCDNCREWARQQKQKEGEKQGGDP